MALNGFDRVSIQQGLRSLYNSAERGYETVGKATSKLKWPLWAALGIAPVVGYQLDRLSEKRTPISDEIPEKNVEINEQREESPVGPPLGAKAAQAPEDEWLEAASLAIKRATAEPTLWKQAVLEGMKEQIAQAKERAKRMNAPAKPTGGFLNSEPQSLEGADQITPVSNQPQYRP